MWIYLSASERIVNLINVLYICECSSQSLDTVFSSLSLDKMESVIHLLVYLSVV